MTIEMRQAKRRLAVIWFGGAGSFLLVVIIQSILGKYADKTDEAIAWLLPTILPTLTLIIAVLGADAAGFTKTPKHVDVFFYRMTASLSAAYLFVVTLTVVLAPFSTTGPLELMRMSNLWLGPIQGLVGGALGVFFIRKEPPQAATAGATNPPKPAETGGGGKPSAAGI